jgi:adiponectin receptor
MNAWTMPISALIVLLLSSWFIEENNLSFSNAIAFISFVTAYWVHLPFSVGYHAFMPISMKVNSLWRKMDVCGIFIRATLLTFATSYFVLPFWGTLLNTFVSALIAFWGMNTFVKTPIHKPLNKLYQALFIGVSVMCHYFPFCFAFLFDFEQLWIFIGMTFTILVGGGCYAFGIPERLSPGTFDLLCNSHVVLHIGIIFSSIFEFLLISNNYFRSICSL